MRTARTSSLTEVVFHAEVRHELFEDIEWIVKVKLSIKEVFGERPVASVRCETTTATAAGESASTQLVVSTAFILYKLVGETRVSFATS